LDQKEEIDEEPLDESSSPIEEASFTSGCSSNTLPQNEPGKSEESGRLLEDDNVCATSSEDEGNLEEGIDKDDKKLQRKRNCCQKLKFVNKGEFLSVVGNARFCIIDTSTQKKERNNQQKQVLNFRETMLNRHRMITSKDLCLLQKKSTVLVHCNRKV